MNRKDLFEEICRISKDITDFTSNSEASLKLMKMFIQLNTITHRFYAYTCNKKAIENVTLKFSFYSITN